MRINLPKFTLIGATTRIGNLTGPFRDRFGVICRLEMYNAHELAVIIKRSAKILDIEIDDDAAIELASRSRGTPRIANRLLKRVRDFAEIYNNGKITVDLTKKAMNLLDIDELGLDVVDKKYLEAVICKFGGGPVGLDTIAAAINENATTIEDVVEPFLLQLGFIARTPRGRSCMKDAYLHMGLEYPGENNEKK